MDNAKGTNSLMKGLKEYRALLSPLGGTKGCLGYATGEFVAEPRGGGTAHTPLGDTSFLL